jgi:hypothetical protein
VVTFWKRISLGLIVVGVIRGFLVAAWSWTKGLDAELIHHVLVVLIGRKRDWRLGKRRAYGNRANC